MNGNINEVFLTAVKEYNFDKTDIQKIEKIIEIVFRDGQKITFIILNIDVYMILNL